MDITNEGGRRAPRRPPRARGRSALERDDGRNVQVDTRALGAAVPSLTVRVKKNSPYFGGPKYGPFLRILWLFCVFVLEL
jgi:hypothetical protein